MKQHDLLNNIVEFPVTSEIASRLYERELERTASQRHPRINRRISRAYWTKVRPVRFPD
jgi:hypothetical protein